MDFEHTCHFTSSHIASRKMVDEVLFEWRDAVEREVNLKKNRPVISQEFSSGLPKLKDYEMGLDNINCEIRRRVYFWEQIYGVPAHV